jgi:RNA polymerase sigma-70 factor (ECF subfamily)
MLQMADLTALAHEARGGDPRSLDEFVVAAYGEVRRLCAALVDEASADDLAQETFIRVLRALHRFRGEASARTWMLAIARNTCADELRSRTRQRRRHRQLVAYQETVPQSAHAANVAVEVSDLISRLEPERREAYVLTQMLGLSYREAAAVCDCPPGTIHSRVARARVDLVSMYSGSTRVRPDRPDAQSDLPS